MQTEWAEPQRRSEEAATSPRWEDRHHARAFDPAALIVLMDALRRAAPRELQDQVTSLIRELLLTLRSLIDWYLERLDQPRREPEVEEIPIDLPPRRPP